MPTRSRPSGIPISRALIVRSGIANDDLRLAIDVINQVHGDGELPPIEVSLGGSDLELIARPADGLRSFDVTTEGSILPRSITVRANASNRSFILVHEIGHLIDAVGLPGVGFTTASLTATDLDGWREAAARSMAVRDLEKLERRAEVALRNRANYLGQAAELWARSYAQFVTIRSGSDILRASLDVLRRRSTSDVYFPRQWDDEDFGPIDTAITNLFGRLGWIE